MVCATEPPRIIILWFLATLIQLTGSALWPSGVVGRLEGVVLAAFHLEGVLRNVRLELHPVLAFESPSLHEKKYS